MAVNIRDVAKKVGVSAASVSLVLNHKECRISEETKQRIFDGAKELGYEIKKVKKRQDKKYNEKLIAVIYASLNNELTEECIQGIENYAYIYDYKIVQMYSSNQSKKCIEQIELAVSLGVAGVIIVPPTDVNEDDNNILFKEVLKKISVPYLLLDEAIHKVFCDFVTIDNKVGVNMAIEKLVFLGHKNIGLLVGKKSAYSTRKIIEGYKEGLLLQGIPFDEDLIYYGDYSKDTGKKGISYFLSKGISTVITCNEEMAFGIYEYSKKNSKRIGEDISIISFGNIKSANWLNPPLTSICRPGEPMGRKALEVIINRVNNEDIGSIKTNYFTPTFLNGESVKKF